MRRSFALALTLLAGCTMTQSNGHQTEVETPPKPEPVSAEKPAQKPPRPERKMTEQAKTLFEKLSDSQVPEPERIRAATRLAELEDPATVKPMMLMLEAELSDALAGEVRKALDLVGATKVLVEDLAEGDEAGRADAARLLGRLQDPDAIPPLMRALSDPAAKVREQAAASLGIRGAREAEPALIERLEKDEAPDVRGAAAQALGLLKTDSAKAALQKALASEKDDFVKVLIQQALR